jgi:hypothetical protein
MATHSNYALQSGFITAAKAVHGVDHPANDPEVADILRAAVETASH